MTVMPVERADKGGICALQIQQGGICACRTSVTRSTQNPNVLPCFPLTCIRIPSYMIEYRGKQPSDVSVPRHRHCETTYRTPVLRSFG